MQWSVALAILRKDLRIFLSDRRAVVMSFAAPVAIGSFFGFLFSGDGGQASARIPIRVLDRDQSPISGRIVSGVAADAHLKLEPAADEASAREAVRKGTATVAVLIPPGFGEAAGQAFFGAGPKPELPLLYDPSHGAELGMVRGILTEYVFQAVGQEMFGGAQGRSLVERSLDRLRTEPNLPDRKALADMLQSVDRWYRQNEQRAGASPAAPGLAMPYEAREEAVTAHAGVAYNGYAHSFAGMGVQFLLFACIDLAMAMLAERRLGLWKRLRAGPVSRATLLFGKTLSGAAVSLLTLLVSFGFGMVVWHIRIQGTVIGFLLVCIATALMAATFGLLVAAIGKTPEATRGVAILAVLLMVMLGGAWVPSFVFPAWLQTAALVVPARWAVDGLDATVWRGVGLGGVLPTIGALLGFALGFGLLAAARFRWDVD